MKISLFLIFLAFVFMGCSQKVQTQTVYKDVYIPVKCNAKLPKKPENKGDFESHKEKMIYFLKVEMLLKQCLGLENESKK